MSSSALVVDTLIKQAKVFNNGETPIIEDVAILDGKIIARGNDLNIESAKRTIDASNYWLMPGLFDIHTHYDLELEVAPGLPESTRHGTTTVVIANCSLGLAFGHQREAEQDPIVDCFARVENLPKSILKRCADGIDWQTPKQYLEHLEGLNLGPNVIALFPHSMLRIDAMGFESSISRDPNEQEMESMENSLSEALSLGYAGFSTDALPFHYLANQPHCDKTIPTQFAKYEELKRLTEILRQRGALWQATPPKDSVYNTLKTFLLTSGRLHGKPLKVTVVAALDIANNWKILKLAKFLARVMNSSLLAGNFHLQALGAPFKVWSDGVITPLAEEIPELRELNELDLGDRSGRLAILNDPEYAARFKSMWMKGKQSWGMARIKRLLNLEDYAFNRKLSDMAIESCPLKSWQGHSFQSVFDRVLTLKRGVEPEGLHPDERDIIQRDFLWVCDEADLVLQLLRTFDTELSWSTVTANRDLGTVRELLMNPLLMPGFNDSGAHLTNMAFYDVNLRSLKLAALGGDADVSYMVKRLSKDAAALFGVEGGTIYPGDVADLILLNPEALAIYDGDVNVQRIHRQEFQHEQLVNRSEGVVPLVMVGGNVAWEGDQFDQSLGQKPFGRLLRSSHSS